MDQDLVFSLAGDAQGKRAHWNFGAMQRGG